MGLLANLSTASVLDRAPPDSSGSWRIRLRPRSSSVSSSCRGARMSSQSDLSSASNHRRARCGWKESSYPVHTLNSPDAMQSTQGARAHLSAAEIFMLALSVTPGVENSANLDELTGPVGDLEGILVRPLCVECAEPTPRSCAVSMAGLRLDARAWSWVTSVSRASRRRTRDSIRGISSCPS